VQAAEAGSAGIEPELEALLAPYSGATPAVDWEPVVRELGRSLRTSRDALTAAEESCRARSADLLAAQRGREQAVAVLQQELAALRTAVDAVFGAQGLQKIKLDRPIPCEPTMLLRMASEVRDGLSG